MRPLTRNEKILLPVLGLILVGGINFFGYKWLSQQQTVVHRQILEARADQAEAKVTLLRADLWAQRRAWLQQHQPVLQNEDDARADELQTVLKGARAHQLEVLEQNLNDVQHGPGGAGLGVNLRVKGSMQGLCEWLAELQKPENFYAVPTFSLKADEDQKSMVCSLQIVRYYKAPSS